MLSAERRRHMQRSLRAWRCPILSHRRRRLSPWSHSLSTPSWQPEATGRNPDVRPRSLAPARLRARGIATPPLRVSFARMAAGRATGQRPLIVVGTGRCGSTFLHRLLAFHDELGWLSTFNETFPRQHWLSVFSRLYRGAAPARVTKDEGLSEAVRGIPLLGELPARVLPARDARRSRRIWPRRCIEPVRARDRRRPPLPGRDRLLVKVTGWARMAYFDRIYPDATSSSCSAIPARSSARGSRPAGST